MTEQTPGLATRKLALDILCDADSRFKKYILEERLAQTALPHNDRHLVTELVNGVIRHRETLMHILRQYSHRLPKKNVVKTALMLGLYQLLFLERVPAYAAIDTTVAILKKYGEASVAPYANAVLRNLQREAVMAEGEEDNTRWLPAFPKKGWHFRRPIFPDPQSDPCEYWATAYSYPLVLVSRWYHRWGPQLCRELLCCGNQPPPIFLRMRPTVARENFMRLLQEQGIAYSLYEELIQISSCDNVSALPGLSTGEVVISGPASVNVVKAMSPQPGQTVLDLCAAPGGKTIQIVDMMGNTGVVVACDIAADRLQLLQKNKELMQLGALTILTMDGHQLPLDFNQYFDQVLVDAPCSNSAVLGKRPEARWRFNEASLAELQKLQLELLHAGSTAVKKGGNLLYSTCSLEVEENQDVIAMFLHSHGHFEIVQEQQLLPLNPHLDGGSFVLLRHRG